MNDKAREGPHINVGEEFPYLAGFEERADDLFLDDGDFEEGLFEHRVVGRVFCIGDAAEVEVVARFGSGFEFDEKVVDAVGFVLCHGSNVAKCVRASKVFSFYF